MNTHDIIEHLQQLLAECKTYPGPREACKEHIEAIEQATKLLSTQNTVAEAGVRFVQATILGNPATAAIEQLKLINVVIKHGYVWP